MRKGLGGGSWIGVAGHTPSEARARGVAGDPSSYYRARVDLRLAVTFFTVRPKSE